MPSGHDDALLLCVLKVEKFPRDLRTKLAVRAAASGGKVLMQDLVARYCREGLERDEANEKAERRKQK
jgi:hypothetical protein